MRLSTNSIYQSGINRIIEAQAEQTKLQEKIATGKEVISAADDPVGATQALKIAQNQQINAQFAANRTAAINKLSDYESNLSSVTELFLQVKTSVIQAGNGTLKDSDRKNIAIQVSSAKEALLALANAKDTNGYYVYSGFKTTTQTYDSANDYKGSESFLNLQVDSNRTMQIGVSGDDVFNATYNMFDTLDNLVTALNTSASDAAGKAALTASLATANTELQDGMDNVINQRSKIGAYLNELDMLNTSGSETDFLYTKQLSAIQDLDYAQAISDLSKNQTILQAAQKTFVTTTGLSLFNYLN